MLWFTSDWHLGHKNVLRFDKRPFNNLAQMNTCLLANINKRVLEDDILYVLGDVAFKISQITTIEVFLKKINCRRKILILGNHDKFKPFEYVDIGFESVHTSLEIDNYILIHDPAIAGCLTERNFICGHVHKLFKKLNNCLNVSCCMWDYQPISLKTIDAIFEEDSKKKG